MADIGGSQTGRFNSPAGLWPQVLDDAITEHDVVTVVREYLATLGPDEISRLPADCRPGKVNDGEDIGDFAFRLATAHLEFAGSRADRLLLERVMGFFTQASSRLAILQATRSP
jgi:hypothetical protein